jgi:cytochrome b subunit of formate dehydrogenase
MSSRKKKPEQTHTDNPPELSKQPKPASNQPEPPKPSTRAVKQPVESNQSISSAKQLAGSKQSTGVKKQPVKSEQSVSAAKPPAKAKESARPEKPSMPAGLQLPPQYERFPLVQRIAHAFLLTSFTLLAITGLPQKFAQAHWAQAMIAFFGGIETTRMIHHVSAIVLMLLAVYHLMDIGYKIFVRRTSLTMLPTLKDVKDALQAFLYNLGFGKTRPQMGRYTFEEKAEYWALIWGTVIMAITGFMMWNPIFTARLLPGEIIPAAKAAHGGEALLAAMAIVVWHMYGVHVRRFNKAMWTGKQTEAEMLHEHPLELADIKAGLADRTVDGQTLRKRRLVYFPIASVLAAVLLFGIYGFMTGEKTAITTVLPISNPVPIYAPQTPTPLPTALPTPTPAASSSSALTWDGSIGQLFQARCSMCHGTNLATNGLSFATYADAIKGAQDGPVIIPGNVEGSKLIVIQSANDHPGQFSVDELTLIKNWIAAGALEK